MKTRNFILAFSAILFWMGTANSRFALAQENCYIKTFTTENGLPHNSIKKIVQDKTGFLWIATLDGLSRWNGYEFRNYYNNPADTTSIIYFQTNDLLVDYQNNIWVITILGISKYNREKDNFTSFQVGMNVQVALDRQGKFWYNSVSGLYRWNYQTNKFEPVSLEWDDRLRALNKIDPLRIKFDNEDRLWISCIEGEKIYFYRCNRNEKGDFKVEFIGKLEIESLPPNSLYYGLRFEPYTISAVDFEVQVDGTLYGFDKKTDQFFSFSGNQEELKLARLRPDDFQKIKQNEEYYKPLLRDKDYDTKINPKYIESYLIDSQNTLWQGIISAGSSSGRLIRTTPASKGFRHHFFELNPEIGLNAIFPVLKDRDGTIWAGPANVNKFFRISKEGKASQVAPFDEKTWKKVRQPRSFMEDSTGIWISYFNNLLLHYDFKSNHFRKEIYKTTDRQDRSLPASLLNMIKEGDDIFILGFKDIFRFSPGTGKMIQLKLFGDESDINLYSFLRDGKNSWWVGRNRSILIHFNDQFNEIESYVIGTGMFNIEEIIQGDNNDLWLSRLGGGLAHFDKSTGKSKIYTTADGLSNNTCYGLLKDKHGNIWISTNHGISRFNPATEHFRVFGPEDGLKIDEFNSDNTYLSHDGELFFGGMGGVVSFYPDSLTDNQSSLFAAPLVIEDFKVSGVNRYFSKAIYACDTVVLKKGDDNFQLTFASLDFRGAEKIKYRYRLKGGNNGFVQTDFRHRFLNYAKLSPGNYPLEIDATNRDGDWVSHTTLLIVIPAYYYQTWWFSLFSVLIVILIIVYFIYGYNQRIRMMARKKQDELKLESLRGQMNPHFIFNSLNSINYFISQNDRLSANRYIADFSRLIRSFLGNLSKEFVPFERELESLRDYLQLEHLRFGDKFDYSIEIHEGLDAERLLVFPGMVQPFIENAVWHGVRGLVNQKGIVTITFLPGGDDHILCIVEDDGIGRKLAEARENREHGRKSRGIGIVTERLRIINQIRKSNLRLTIEDRFPDQEETGTKVSIEIPMVK